MKITSIPAEIAPDEAAARFTRATEILMRAAERRKAAQALVASAVSPVSHSATPVPFIPTVVPGAHLHHLAASSGSGGRFSRQVGRPA